jgi:hypothetical protein
VHIIFLFKQVVNRAGATPLLIAARAGSSEMCHALLRQKADPRAADTHGSTVRCCVTFVCIFGELSTDMIFVYEYVSKSALPAAL